jgi:hypothetical protein
VRHFYSTNAGIFKLSDSYDALFYVNFKLTNNAVFYDRGEYSSLQFLGDVSALFEALMLIATAFLYWLWQIQVKLQNQVINGVYRLRNEKK